MSGAIITGRRLAFHGVLLFLAGLLMGVVVPYVANPRMGLSAHTGTLLNAAFLVALAPIWAWVSVGPRAERAAYWLTVGGSWAGCIFLFLAGVFGTSSSTPLHGAGHVGTPFQEALVAAGLSIGGLALVIGVAMLAWGLRGGPAAR